MAISIILLFAASTTISPAGQSANAIPLVPDGDKIQPEQASTTNEPDVMIPVKTIAKTNPITVDPSMHSMPVGKNCATNLSERPNPIQYLTYFNCGHITHKDGTTYRQFSLIASENSSIPISDVESKDPVLFNAWTYNDTIPGPTMRVRRRSC